MKKYSLRRYLFKNLNSPIWVEIIGEKCISLFAVENDDILDLYFLDNNSNLKNTYIIMSGQIFNTDFYINSEYKLYHNSNLLNNIFDITKRENNLKNLLKIT